MPIITISRGSKIGGQALAEMVAERLNCPNLISREVLVKVSEEHGVSEKALATAMNEPPHFWSRSTRTTRRLYLTFIRAALLEYAAEGCMVYHGNAGHFLLSEVDWVLKVRLIAPVEYRISALQQTMKIDRYEAERYIKKADDERRRWTKFLYNEDWDDPSHFDVVINLKNASLDTASNTICGLANSPEYERTEKRALDVANRALAARVQVAFEANPKTREADVDVCAEGGVVYLCGQIAHDNLRSELVEAAAKVRGVSDLVDKMTIL